MIIEEANRIKGVEEYYFSRKLQEIKDLQQQGRSILNLGIGNPDMTPSLSTIDALITSVKTEKNHGYQSYKGIIELRKAMANWYKKTYEIKLDSATEILPLLGSKEGIMHISMAFVNAGDEVLIPNPGYPTYNSVSNIVGATIKTYKLDETNNWNINIEKLKQQNLSKVKIMWVNCPHMPTGSVPDKKVFNELIELARKNKFLICNDNPYSMILNETPQSILQYEGAKDVAIELNSLSKSHNMAGWRLGWVSGKKEYISSILKVKSNVDSGMFLPIQHAAIEALKNDNEWHQQLNKKYEERRELVWQLFDEIGCTYKKNQVGLFVWAKLPKSIINTEKFVDTLLYKCGVFITPGFVFGTQGNGYLRASLCVSPAVIEEAKNRLKLMYKAR